MATCSSLCKVGRRKDTQNCYFWYVLTGCDMVSQFLGRGKPIKWKAWKAFLEVTDTFIKLSWSGEISTADFEMIQHFNVLMYDRTCPHKAIEKCCKYLFTQMNSTMDNFPPTTDALV